MMTVIVRKGLLPTPPTNTTFALNIHTHRGSLCLMMAAMRDDDTSALTAELKLVSVKR